MAKKKSTRKKAAKKGRSKTGARKYAAPRAKKTTRKKKTTAKKGRSGHKRSDDDDDTPATLGHFMVKENMRAAEELLRAAAAGVEHVPKLDLTGVRSRLQRAFLTAYSVCGVIARACAQADMSRSTYAKWMREDPAFQPLMEEAREIAIELAEAEAFRRAVEGTIEPVYFEGMLVGGKRVYSDQLMRMLLEARKPETYRRRHSHEHSGPGGGPIQTSRLQTDDDLIAAAVELDIIDELPPRLREKYERQQQAEADDAGT